MRWRSSTPPRIGSWPRTVTAPLVGRRYPSRISTVVDLPAPFGPSIATDSPAATRNDTPRTASNVP